LGGKHFGWGGEGESKHKLVCWKKRKYREKILAK
jgi:hypothetical protein